MLYIYYIEYGADIMNIKAEPSVNCVIVVESVPPPPPPKLYYRHSLLD